jgi:hypothetical protein
MVEQVSDGLVRIVGTASCYCGLWTRVKARPRGHVLCEWSGRAIVKGALIYRPLTHGVRRGERILADEVEKRIVKGKR